MGTIRSSHIFFLIRNYLIRLLPPCEVQKQKRKTFRSSFSVPPQVVPVTHCVPRYPDFRTLVWLWSSKNVASPDLGGKPLFPSENIVVYTKISNYLSPFLSYLIIFNTEISLIVVSHISILTF